MLEICTRWPASLGAQVRRHGLADPQRAEEVRLELRRGPRASLNSSTMPERQGAGVVDDDVEPAEARDRRVDGGEHGGAVGDVERRARAGGPRAWRRARRARRCCGRRRPRCRRAASAAVAKARPRPRLAPVMNQTRAGRVEVGGGVVMGRRSGSVGDSSWRDGSSRLVSILPKPTPVVKTNRLVAFACYRGPCDPAPTRPPRRRRAASPRGARSSRPPRPRRRGRLREAEHRGHRRPRRRRQADDLPLVAVQGRRALRRVPRASARMPTATPSLPDTGDLAADLELVLRATVDEFNDPALRRADAGPGHRDPPRPAARRGLSPNASKVR